MVDYYPFGSAMAGRKFSSGAYRYGFNGMEKDDEVKGEGNSYTTHYRLYDSRTGRWFSPDPVTISSLSPYVGIDDNPITKSDPNGDLACCNFAGAGANIMMEYGEQVIGNVIKGGLSTRAFIQDVDFADVLIEGADGLVNGAIPDAVKEVAKAGINYKGGKLTIQPLEKALREGLISSGVNQGVKKSVGATKSVIKKHNQNLSKDLSKSTKEVQKFNNISGNGRPRKAQTNRAAKATSNNIKIATAKEASDRVVKLVDKVSSTPVPKVAIEFAAAVAINETIKNPLNDITNIGREIKLPSNVERDANGNVFINGERMYELPDNTRIDKEDVGGRLVNKDAYKKVTGGYPQ